MSHPTPRLHLPLAWLRLAWLALAVAAVSLSPTTAAAQGRCSCNNGCHQYPGQCVQPGSNGCATGFAPFCSTRGDTCPNASWVSCGGECTCVRIGPVDAGGPSADVPAPVDTPASADAPAARDVPASFDAPATSDRPVGGDASPALDTGSPVGADAPGVDAPASDAIAPRPDVPAPVGDAPVGLDAGAAASDASAVGDAACECPGGACVDGVCYRDRCDYNPELGFVCTIAGTACRLIGDVPLCIPLCAGITCTGMTFCDERAGGRCVSDECATIQCPAGTSCRRNQCERAGDGGAVDPLDGSAGDGSTSGSPTTATEDGCGCRAGGGHGRPAGGALLAVAACMAALARRRRGRA